MSGLDCRTYLEDYRDSGSQKFKKKHFKNLNRVRLKDVKYKLKKMVSERRHAMVPYFLVSIIVGETKNSGKNATLVDSLSLRSVNDLEFCATFPWGRYSFEHMLKLIAHTMRHIDGVVEREVSIWPVQGFCIPIEVSAVY
ncbi:uncharacterized protein LOC111830598 [Capsella rubella]|uniref:uncharacterized protein LOC111830598 n=1 Tax=Capsella rubella TaxID=81985 RepID=UPI000CD4ECA2|nr:uncharacterized protein LOC111830598 [Capsella rubella]